jgi:tRNA(fMet)-specific endonuclease VapC
MILLDTNICIYIINARSHAAVGTLRAHAQTTSDIGISSITLAELEYGVAASASVEKNRRGLDRFLTPLDVVPFDDTAARRYGTLRAALKRAGTPIGSNDTFIAAHALALGATLVTNNEREFRRVPELQIENWFTEEEAH